MRVLKEGDTLNFEKEAQPDYLNALRSRIKSFLFQIFVDTLKIVKGIDESLLESASVLHAHLY